MVRRMVRRLAGLLVVIAAVSCGGALADGKSAFKKGRYAEARQTFETVERESRTWDDRKRAEYALYRGLTHGALGDRAAGLLWLREAKAIEDARPGTLTADDRTRLVLGLESVDPSQAAATP
jgi:hypothetical protein